MIDLLIAGAGPVGLVTAIHAAQAGLDVAIIDPRVGTIDKACGEGLMPQALEHLRGIQVNPPGIDFVGIRYIADGKSVDAKFTKNFGRGVRRTTLHDQLRNRASQLNIKIIDGKVREIRQEIDYVEAAGIQSRYLIGADGLHSTVRSQLNLYVPPKRNSAQRYGLRQHFAIAPWSNFVEVCWLPDAELYITPVDNQTVGIAILGTETMDFWGIIAQYPDLEARLRSVEPASKLRGAGPLRQRTRARTIGRALLVGDAAGYVDALTGEGMRMGFEEGRAAVESVLANNPHKYESDWRKITRSYRVLAGSLLWASSNRLVRPMIVPAAKTLPSVFSRIVNTLG